MTEEKITNLEKQIEMLEERIEKMNKSIDLMPVKYGRTVREFIKDQIEYEIYKQVTQDLIKIKVYKAMEEIENDSKTI